MKVNIHRRENAMSLNSFADHYGLTLELRQRSLGVPAMEWYAAFASCEELNGIFLRGISGDGATPIDAAVKLAEVLSGKLVVIHAYGPDRKEVRVPHLAGVSLPDYCK